jgi:hypothetical protein
VDVAEQNMPPWKSRHCAKSYVAATFVVSLQKNSVLCYQALSDIWMYTPNDHSTHVLEACFFPSYSLQLVFKNSRVMESLMQFHL